MIQKKRKPQAKTLSKEISNFFNTHPGYPKKTQINKLRKENKEEDQEFLMWMDKLKEEKGKPNMTDTEAFSAVKWLQRQQNLRKK